MCGLVHVAVCHNGCPAPRICTAPNTCQCTPGYTGEDCAEGKVTSLDGLLISPRGVHYIYKLELDYFSNLIY